MAASSRRDQHDVTLLLRAWAEGDRCALDRLLPLIYGELRWLARRSMRREALGHTLQPTELVHEAYLRLVDQRATRWESRTQFFAVSAQLMRRILVDHARARLRAKRGGGRPKVFLEEGSVVAPERAAEVVAVDDALRGLHGIDPRKSRVVELRFFGGLSVEETAQVLRVSPVTVMRDWNAAKAWLYHEIQRR